MQASFSFIGIPDLRAIPLAVLNRLEPVPATFLKQLANDRELFGELPDSVQRQVRHRLCLSSYVCPLQVPSMLSRGSERVTMAPWYLI